MDSLRSPRLGRRGRYDYFADFPPFSDLNNRPHPHLHPPFSPLALHPAEPPLPVFRRNHHHETRKAFAHPPGDDFYFPLPYRPNSPGFDPAPFPTPRVSEHAIYHDRPHDNPLPPEIWMRDRGGRGVLENPGVIDEKPGRSGPYDNFSKFGGPDPDLMSRRRAEFEQDRFLREDFDWRNQQKLRFWDEQESRCHDPFFQKLPPETVYLATDPPAFSSSRGLCSAGSVSNRGGEDSRALVHPSPMSRLSYDHSFSDQHIISSNVVENSQLFGNGFGPQQGQSIFTKKNYVRDVPPNNGFGRRQHQEYSNPSMDYEHELEVDRSISKGKRKMPNDRNAKYYARSTKQPMQKPSAFSRLQKGLSVWDRLEKKPLILSPPSSPPCLLPSPPRISNDTEEKLDTIGFSVKSNALVSMIVDPPSIEPSSIKDLSVERPADKPIRIVKKKKKKKSQIRGEAKTHVIVVSAGSSAKQDVVKISNDSSFGSVSVKAEANKVEVSSCMPGNEFVPNKFKKKIKKLPVVKLHRVKEAAKIVSQVEGCTTEIPMMVDCVGAPKFEGGDKYEKEINDCSPNKDTGDKLIDDCCLKDQLTLETPTSDISSMIIINAMNQTKDCAVEIHDDIGEKSLELGKTFDNECRSPYVSDALVVNVNSQPSDYIIPSNKLTLNSVTTHDSSLNMEENAAKNSRKQVKLEVTGSIKPDMPTPDNATTPELLGAGEVFITAGSKTLSYIDDSLICNSAEIEIERPVKKQEKMVFLTATKQPEVPGKHLSSQSCLHDLHDPSFSEISNAAANQKLSNDGIVIENNEFSLPSFNMLPQSGCGMSSQNSSCTPKVYASGVRLEQALPLGPMKMDSPALHLADAFPSHPLYSESTKFINNTSSGYEDKDHRGKCKTFVRTLSSSALKSVHESCNTNNNNQIISENTQVLPFYELNKQTSSSSKLIGEQSSQKKPLSQYEASRFLSNTPKTSVQLKEVARTCQSGRHRTWLRTNTLLHSDENQKRVQTSSNQDSKKLGKVQNSSYIRKGNSLIRKIANEPLPVILPAVGAASRKCKSITERNSVRELRGEFLGNETPSYPLFERPNTPPLPPPSKLSDYTINSCNDFPRLREGNTPPEPVTDEGNQFDVQSKGIPSGNFGSQDTTSFKIVETNNPKSVTYVKHKKNEVVAAPGTEIGDSALTERFQTPIHSSTETKTVPFSRSYLYYRSKRNQLIRSACSSDTQLTGIPAGDANLIDSIQKRKTLPIKRLDVHQKTKKPLISSLVWRLGGDKLSQKSIATLGCQKAFPYLFPWKRSVNWNSFILNDRIPISSRFSLSLISRKLQCLRKRDTIYKRSTDGFSLRKAGVVSIGGSNLKWSKSIEKRSKKASEEATLAVAEVERTKRERKKSKSTCHNGKNKLGLTCRSACYTGQKHDDTRERIFRFGSARYKMDSTKRTLIRIPDDGLLSSTNQQGNNSLKHFVPRRLIIENNEYVRIGNGNQLVRDPKKLKRILASEKIRWSLHTARLKLARKRQYCLFFTRFGKCSKSEGKCPYIHDSSKVAICTKFLKSQCSDINCKLTHKVIPERMPDCSYFLKGLCTNINCPYRHVKVNANAPLCDGFLRGHCADGDECCKKHSYTCPFFEATGKCPQGLLCKLRHPKSQSKSRKRKRTKLKSSNQGRYFCSSLGKAGEPLRVAYSPNDLKDVNDIFCSDGRFTEYINLDSVSDNTGGIENDVLMDSYPGKLNSGYFDMQSCDIDALIKPLRIMNKDDLTIF